MALILRLKGQWQCLSHLQRSFVTKTHMRWYYLWHGTVRWRGNLGASNSFTEHRNITWNLNIWQEMDTHLFSEPAGAFSSPSGAVSGAAVCSASLGRHTANSSILTYCLQLKHYLWVAPFQASSQIHSTLCAAFTYLMLSHTYRVIKRWNWFVNTFAVTAAFILLGHVTPQSTVSIAR